MEAYRFDQVVQTLHAFSWDEYCSWYLEIAKIELADDTLSKARKDGVRQTLVNVLDAALRMLHPIMPFITEALWQKLRSRTLTNSDSIMYQPYPQFEPNQVDDKAVADMEWVQAVVGGVRNIRGEMNIDPRKQLPVLLQGGNDLDRHRARGFHTLLAALARLQSLAFVANDEDTPQSAMALSGEMKILVPLGSVIDRAAELKRLEREVEKLTGDLQRCQTKLSNPDFVARAPEDIVTKEKNRADQLARDIEELESQRTRVASL
jgi:valyl-tRNA synthetase